jgi:hypothetical protein
MIEIKLNLEFNDGNFQQGFSKIYLKIDVINSNFNIESRHNEPLEAQLSPAPEIPVCYQAWKKLYSYLTNSKRAFKDKPTNISISEHEQILKQEQQERHNKAEEYCQQIELLRQSLNQWLEPVKSQLNALIPSLQRLKQELENVAIIDFRPGNNPVENLAIALNKRCYQLGEQQAEWEEITSKLAAQIELEEQLHDDETKLCHFIENLINISEYKRLLLVIDQFEELYTLTPENIRHSFLNTLLLAVKHAPKFTLVLTIRADFYGHALSYRPFCDALQGVVYNLGPMDKEELRNAIEKPAAKMKVELEEGLTSRIINDLGNQAGRLPLLEFALTQLWKKQKNSGNNYSQSSFKGNSQHQLLP